MKVSRQEKKRDWVPVVITLETEEEAAHLWHRLNCANDETFRRYSLSRNLRSPFDFDILWATLDTVFRPGRVE